MPAYYNEIDPYAAQWLRNLIAAGHIADGFVDERSIEDVYPSDLKGFTQCHFFAGIGVWSLALRRAGWPDDRPVWTGSCPCQPFSAAGQGAGFDDERHLWPAFHHLIRERKPAAVLGEQVASSDAAPWLDLVQTDLEALGYAFGAVPFPSAGVGAPHIRDRLYWAADAPGSRLQGCERGGKPSDPQQPAAQRNGEVGGLADHLLQQRPDGQPSVGAEYDQGGRLEGAAAASGLCGFGGLADSNGGHAGAEREQRGGEQRQQSQDSGTLRLVDPAGRSVELAGSGSVNGTWADADWLRCRDGKWRPVEPGTFPLAHGATARVGRLRAYGNAINAEAARVFIEAVMA